MESPEIRPTGNGSPRHAEEPFFQSRSLEEPPFAGESFDTDRVLMEQPHQGGATTPDNSEAKSCSEGDPLTAETEGGTRGESNAPEAQHIALDPPSDDGPCHSDDLDAMRHKLRAAEQRADNNQKRLAQVQAASRRDKARWEEERARLNKQVDDLREVVDAGVKEREVLESSVNQLANQLESRLTALSGNVEERDAEVSQLRDENEKMSKAFEEMRMLLKQSVDHRAKLNEEMLSMERQLARARKEASESQAALEKARRDHMEANMSLAEAQADADRWKADGGLAAEERERLHSELEDARRAAEKALQDLAGTREQLEAAEASSREANEMRLEAERLRREAQAEAQSALCAAEAERVQRAEAEGQSEQLKSESERRARVFNNAVKAAVHKIQRELEEENASLQERVRAAEAAAAAAAKRVKEAEQAAAEAYNEAAERSNDAEAAGNHAVAAQEAADRAKAKEQEAERRAEDAAARCKHAERAREQLETELRSANAKAEVLILLSPRVPSRAISVWKECLEPVCGHGPSLEGSRDGRLLAEYCFPCCGFSRRRLLCVSLPSSNFPPLRFSIASPARSCVTSILSVLRVRGVPSTRAPSWWMKGMDTWVSWEDIGWRRLRPHALPRGGGAAGSPLTTAKPLRQTPLPLLLESLLGGAFAREREAAALALGTAGLARVLGSA
mmetsp:Transcript_36369/g.86343  ORF Transcript_36369/g.86343 Transcript_36369/m.86343 type:complete len:679 (+) Transcript_36369:785-2821(+)